jgi:predicted RNA binding protein YcfA (HicA-like mRNA interferase family)
MGRQEDKRIARFKRFSNNYTYDELVWVLGHFGFFEKRTGKTSGSRTVFVNQKGQKIKVHKPHPGNTLKRGTAKDVYQKMLNYGIDV